MSDGAYSVVEALSMIVDVTWDGVPLARGATAREQEGGWFVELEQPMPVGATVVVSGEVQATAVVERVHEGVGAGVNLRKAGGQPSAAEGEPEAPSGDKKEKRSKKKR